MVDLAYVIAGSEATGGAGLQADLKTFQELGVYGVGTLTCIVSFDPKNGWGHRFVPVDPGVIADQIEAATAAHDLDVVKIGMLGTPATIDVVAAALAAQQWRHVVLDPVLICKGQEPGAALDTDTALREKVLPLATVVTPNLFEAKILSGMEVIETEEQLIEAAQRIHALGPEYVVVKGGVDLPGDEAVDVLYDGAQATVFKAEKIGAERVSGAGCTLAAAITAELAKGVDIEEAVAFAKEFVTAGIEGRVAANTPFDTVWQGAYVEQLALDQD
ncbi:MAG: bifunctional hydroxymethylpyrimidine kinase/phosphomethylpyrimidine kinase [Gordonia sp. (in: high G+C Gram-positive bacteria)]|uniref:bifunctional hydroxymethylpyrimidine kinase/phosphomethylpyrimidine kinase n=1 Tax=Gordonia sp. (in: high G+C Gram-positive bacteria) TaxID=84139 RepID=UPI0039E25A39